MGVDREVILGYVFFRKKGKKRCDFLDDEDDFMDDMVDDGVIVEEMLGGDEVMEVMNGDLEGVELLEIFFGVNGNGEGFF